MSSPASVEGRDRLRLFLGLPLHRHLARSVAAWQREHLRERIVAPGHLHVTLAFLGGRPAGELAAIVGELREAALAARRPQLTVVRYRETRSVGMLVLEDAGGYATALAGDVHERLERLGVYRRERRPWLPHVTVVRFRTPPRLSPPLPELGVVSPSEAAVYHSVLRPGGAQYEILESVALGG